MRAGRNSQGGVYPRGRVRLPSIIRSGCYDRPAQKRVGSTRFSFYIPISLSSRSVLYTLRSASTITWLATCTERETSSVYTKRFGRLSILPSNRIPVSSPFVSMVGLPELPPCESTVVTKLNGVESLSEDFAFTQLGGRAKGSTPVARL